MLLVSETEERELVDLGVKRDPGNEPRPPDDAPGYIDFTSPDDNCLFNLEALRDRNANASCGHLDDPSRLADRCVRHLRGEQNLYASMLTTIPDG